MNDKKDGLIKFDILKLKSLKDVEHVIDHHLEKEAKKRLQEENDRFDHFVNTGEVIPIPDKNSSLVSHSTCRSMRVGNGIHQQTVRKLFMPKNPKRKFRL